MTEKEFREKYYPELTKQTLATLPKFLDEILNQPHDYGTICCAVAASALAAAWAANHSEHDGITGFQGGAVMWEFIQQWQYSSNKTGLRIIDYDNMLYSQYENSFDKTISKSVFESLQKEADRLLLEDNKEASQYIADMSKYERELAVFKEKHPDYEQNPAKYEKLHSGTSNQWDVERKKEESGFEFAPDKPCYFRGQIEHWQSIVDGIVPFGYKISSDS